MQKVLHLENQLAEGLLKIDSPSARRYFAFQKTKDGTYNIHRKTAVIDQEKRLAGYFVILTNHYKDPETVLEIYRRKDVVEKSFDNLKNDLDMERLRIHSDVAMDGRILIGFISLIIMSYIREQMRIHDLYRKFSFNELIAELKKLRVILFKNGKKMLTEVSATQKVIFRSMGMKVPASASIVSFVPQLIIITQELIYEDQKDKLITSPSRGYVSGQGVRVLSAARFSGSGRLFG